MFRSKYNIRLLYRHRSSVPHFDDMDNTDEWQKEVYEEAVGIAEQNGYNDIIDYGCGSAYKAINLLKKFNITGIEIEPTLQKIKSKYPYATFLSPTEIPNVNHDLVICSDVIEHVKDPDEFLVQLLKIKAKKYIFSTPARELLYAWHHIGPPKNIHHFREWSSSEFKAYLNNFFTVEKAYISNFVQSTQVIICSPKITP